MPEGICNTHFTVACPACRTPQSACACKTPPVDGIVGRKVCSRCAKEFQPSASPTPVRGFPKFQSDRTMLNFQRCDGCKKFMARDLMNSIVNGKREMFFCSDCMAAQFRVGA